MPPDPSVAFTPSQSLGRWLGAVDALGGSEWSSSDQLRYVRSFLEQGIEGLARAEDARFDLLADCAMLASQNMQDARLHITDERLAELENPDSDASIGQFFVELGVILALELVVVATAGYAIPALIALTAAGARARRVRRLTEGLSHTLEGAVTKRQAASASLKALGEAVAEKEEAFYRFGRFFQWYEQPVEPPGGPCARPSASTPWGSPRSRPARRSRRPWPRRFPRFQTRFRPA